MQIDFVVALGIFVITIFFVIYAILLPVENISDIELKFKAYKVNNRFLPNVIGIGYTCTIIANNSSPNDIKNEIVKFNYTKLPFSIDPNSTTIYDENGKKLNYDVNNGVIKFITNLSAYEVKRFYVYFNDDSHFLHKNTGINGNDTINETITALRIIQIVERDKLLSVNATPYSNFSRILNADFNLTVDTFGYGVEPEGRNIVSFEQPVFYETEEGIKRGALRFMVIK